VKLSELKTGEKASIVKVMGHGGFRKRIVEMGFVKGKVVQSILNAPLNDPIKYRVMGYEVSLRRSEASLIEVVSHQEALQWTEEKKESISFVDEDTVRQIALKKRKNIRVALVGNPNCGKTTLFNVASGGREHVGNYSGVTVDAKEGKFEFEGYTVTLVDLPGTYSISAYSPEEKYVRGYITEKIPDVIVNVIDSTNLERNLYLTTQLIDMNVRTVIALNMYDEFEDSGDKLDHKTLGKLLGIPIVPTVAKKQKGIDDLFRTVIKFYEGSDVISDEGVLLPTLRDDDLVDAYLHNINIHHQHDTKHHASDLMGIHRIHETARHIHIYHGTELEKSIQRLKVLIAQNLSLRDVYSTRFLAIKLLENDSEIEQVINTLPNAEDINRLCKKEKNRIKQELNERAESAITDAKYGFIDGALKEVWKPSKSKHKHKQTSRIDSYVTHKYWGYPIFLLLIYTMFQSTFSLGKYPMDWIENGVNALSLLVQDNMPGGSLQDLLVEGILGGVGGVIVFLPNILILYFFISLMEDSGYMARAAFIMDKFMHKMGLHGKSFIPLIMGFGCNVPAILATRTIENKNSRMITILINPFMSCSARLPVYLLLAGAFFPDHAGLVLFGIYASGIVLAIVMARIFKRFVFKKEETPFVMELPPYRMPTMKSMLNHTWEKGVQYLRKMGTIILIGSIAIWFLEYFPRPEKTGVLTPTERIEQQEKSYIGQIGHAIEPILSPLGFDWKIGVSLISVIAAKEIVVSTMGVLYTGDAEKDQNSLSERLKKELKPNGEPVFTPAIAIGLMLFVLIYFPCLATIVAIKNETKSWLWALFSVSYSLILAWTAAFGVYQIFG
jgi:ferrous iron transport protein B